MENWTQHPSNSAHTRASPSPQGAFSTVYCNSMTQNLHHVPHQPTTNMASTKQRHNLKQRRRCHPSRSRKRKKDKSRSHKYSIASTEGCSKCLWQLHLVPATLAGQQRCWHGLFKTLQTQKQTKFQKDLLPGVPLKPIGDGGAHLWVKKVSKHKQVNAY